MAKERTDEEKKVKKEKKHKHSETNGVKKEKKDKKEKKEKKEKREKKAAALTAGDPDAATALLNKLEDQKPGSVKVDSKDDAIVKMDVDADEGEKVTKVKKQLLVGAMVPFADPMADEKQMKKLLKGTKRAAKNKAIKRGVKECVKALRKLGDTRLQPKPDQLPRAIVILAADISPMDVISHIPVLCEDHHIPYVFVPSRAELGAAGSTKRPTSIVMITPKPGKVKAEADEDAEPWEDSYKDLVKVVEKASKNMRT